MGGSLHEDEATGKVDVSPMQSKDLAAAHAGSGRNSVQRLGGEIRSSVEDLANLVTGEVLHFLARY